MHIVDTPDTTPDNLPGHHREQRLARSRPHRRRPDLLDQDDLLRRHPHLGPLRDRHVPLPRAARRRPDHRRRPTTAAAHRQDLALGHPHRRRVPPTPRRLHLTTHAATPTRRPGDPTTSSASRALTHPHHQPRQQKPANRTPGTDVTQPRVGSGAGAVRQHMRARFQPPPVKPCVRFSRTRLTDVVHRRHSVSPASPGRVWVRRWSPVGSGRSARVRSVTRTPRRTSRSGGSGGAAWR